MCSVILTREVSASEHVTYVVKRVKSILNCSLYNSGLRYTYGRKTGIFTLDLPKLTLTGRIHSDSSRPHRNPLPSPSSHLPPPPPPPSTCEHMERPNAPSPSLSNFPMLMKGPAESDLAKSKNELGRALADSLKSAAQSQVSIGVHAGGGRTWCLLWW